MNSGSATLAEMVGAARSGYPRDKIGARCSGDGGEKGKEESEVER